METLLEGLIKRLMKERQDFEPQMRLPAEHDKHSKKQCHT